MRGHCLCRRVLVVAAGSFTLCSLCCNGVCIAGSQQGVLQARGRRLRCRRRARRCLVCFCCR